MYDELIKRLWECASGECFNCSQYAETTNASVCSKELMKQAADAIEELLDFAHFVASNVVVSDEEWDNNMLVFPEVASRKLNKLGIMEKDGACWSYEPPKEE